MNNLSENALIVVYDNKSGKYRVVNIIDKTISFSSFDKECDAENLMNDMKDIMNTDLGVRLRPKFYSIKEGRRNL